MRQQLAAEEIAGARLPSGISGYTIHGLDQAISREGVGVSVPSILDTMRNPLSIAGQSGGRFVLGGASSQVVLNVGGDVITVVPFGSAAFRIGF